MDLETFRESAKVDSTVDQSTSRRCWHRFGLALLLALGACSNHGNDQGANGGEFVGTDSGLTFSPEHGVYEDPLDVTITHPTADSIRYTLDCSDPRTSTNAITAPLPLVLHVDPADTDHRFLAPGFVIRATIGDANAPPESVITQSYLFPHRTIELSPDGRSPGQGWPTPLPPERANSQQAMDYGMDPDIVDSSEYSSQMDGALTSLPNLSLVVDLPGLFDAATGIYANAVNEGVKWERFGSIELLNQDRAPGFQANAGVRIRGGHSRRTQNPKHSFRLLFKGDYGTPKLEFPLFGNEGPSRFDKVDLRTQQNYGWAGDGAEYGQMTFTHDVFSRDLQRELGRPYTRSRYYHLYLDGVYWGLYQTQERSEAKYAETYFGGDSQDYDTVKTERNNDLTQVEATDGDLTVWNSIWQLCQTGFTSDEAYYRLEGKDQSGSRDATLPVLVDIDNLIDYMLIIFYTSNFDAPTSKWFNNREVNNFFALRNRVSNDQGFVFFQYDSEHTLMADPITITTGVDENRVSIGEPGGATDDNGRASDAYRMVVTDASQFHPQWLHFRLSDNARYRERFAARAHDLLDGNGAMTEGPATKLHQERVDEVSPAMVAESARWGDAQRPDRPRTVNDDFLPAVARIHDGFFPQRTAIVIEQLSAAGLY